jgi:hypothetical protein
MTTTVIFKSSLESMGYAIQEMLAKGWKIDPTNPLQQNLFQYVCGFTHDGEPLPKLSRAEILANARAAKAAKKEGNENV